MEAIPLKLIKLIKKILSKLNINCFDLNVMHYMCGGEALPQPFSKEDEEVYWTVTFDDGQNVTKIRVKDGEILNAEDFPSTPTKQGFEFVGWVHGIDGIYSFDATSPIKAGYYLTATWAEKTESVAPPAPTTSVVSKKGCFGSINAFDMAAGLLLVAGGMLFIKRKRA